MTPASPMPIPCQALLFDLDGTLVDSSPDLWRAMNHVLEQRGYPLLEHDEVRHLVGDGARFLLARGFGGVKATPPAPGADPAFETAVALFLEFYGEHLTDHSRPYPGVMETLEQLRREGYKLAVVTNKPEHLSIKMLNNLGMMELFGAVVGGDTLPRRKPDPDPLLLAMDRLGVNPAGTVMVGDSKNDVLGARHAGCPVVAVTFGYCQGREVAALNPDRMVDRFSDLADLVTPA